MILVLMTMMTTIPTSKKQAMRHLYISVTAQKIGAVYRIGVQEKPSGGESNSAFVNEHSLPSPEEEDTDAWEPRAKAMGNGYAGYVRNTQGGQDDQEDELPGAKVLNMSCTE